jgi:hypothetical protein
MLTAGGRASPNRTQRLLNVESSHDTEDNRKRSEIASRFIPSCDQSVNDLKGIKRWYSIPVVIDKLASANAFGASYHDNVIELRDEARYSMGISLSTWDR